MFVSVKKVNLLKSRKFYIWLLLFFLFFLLIFYFKTQEIKASVWNMCKFSQSQHPGDCVEALASFVDDKNQKIVFRNRAIWALGQLGDKRAMWILNKYSLSEENKLSQLDLGKAIKLVSAKYSLTAWLWRSEKFYTNNNSPNSYSNTSTKLLDYNYLAEGVFPINKSKSVKLLLFGDLMLDRHVLEKIKLHSLDSLLNKLNEDEFTQGYDVVGANLEGAVTNEGKHYLPHNLYDFAFNPEIISQLKDYNLANNHLSDQGSKGIEETYENLSQLGFNYAGCQDASLAIDLDNIPFSFISDDKNISRLSLDNCSARILEVNGHKLGILAFSIVYRNINEDELIRYIEELKKQVKWLVVMPHWGIEYQAIAVSSQINLARKIIDAGADAIVGHHPHVIQNYEVYDNKPIFYSLGNFVFDQYFSKETQESLAISLILESDKDPSFTIYKLKSRGSKIEQIERQELEN